MKNFVMVVLIAIFGLSASAQEKKNKNAKYQFEVNGNCDQCKKRIEKAAYSVAGVKSAVWSIESHQFTVFLNEEKVTLQEVKSAIAKAGHDTDDIKASDEDYKNLHSCCLYDRE